jgi:hypothetical protein
MTYDGYCKFGWLTVKIMETYPKMRQMKKAINIISIYKDIQTESIKKINIDDEIDLEADNELCKIVEGKIFFIRKISQYE